MRARRSGAVHRSVGPMRVESSGGCPERVRPTLEGEGDAAAVMGRVLIVCLLKSEVEIAGLNEAVVGKASISRVFSELIKKPEPVFEHVPAKPLEGEGLRNVVEKDFPGALRVF